jgi:tetratricopeptide (TPR) repeat protein
MPAPVTAVNLTTGDTPATGSSQLGKRLFLILAAIALIYAFLAGLRTVSEFDLGWQMATGRWVVQHHHIPSTDVFSYTAQGEPWIYPVGAGLLFYFAYLLGGYGLLSWLGAAACVGAIALLLRRGSAVTAGITILAVPLIAWRTAPRAEMFTVVLFAAFLSLLWENYQTGRARLWLLPLLMLAWVNLHVGFVAGLALIVAYVVIELADMIFSGRQQRAAVQRRLRQASGWLACTVFITLANPWGWNIYRALLLQERALGQHQINLTEWRAVPTTWTAFGSGLSLRETQGAIYLLIVIAVVAAVLGLLKRQWGATILLLPATYLAMRHVRMGAVFACVVVVVGGSVLAPAIAGLGSRVRRPRIRSIAAWAAACLLVVLAGLRSFDLVTNRHYVRAIDESTFGAGLGWWFPQRAAEFIERENLPGEIFNAYDEGGYVTWKLGPKYHDYVDGRAIPFGVPRIQRARHLLQLSPDSETWRQETERYNINTMILPLARFDGAQLVNIGGFCNSRDWRPVYLDEISAVFVRRTPETEPLIQRTHVDCATAPLPVPPLAYSRAGSFNQWANAASLLAGLGRNSEALSATDQAISTFPDSAFVRWLRGALLYGQGRQYEAEQEYLLAVSLDPSEATWSALATLYQQQQRVSEAIDAWQQASALSPKPYLTQVKLAHYYLQIRQPKSTLEALDEAVRMAPAEALADTGEKSLRFDVALGRSAAWDASGDLQHAVSFQEEATRLAPDNAAAWSRLAKLYQREGRFTDEFRADERATALAGNQSH